MKTLTYLALHDDDLREVARALPVEKLRLADLLPGAGRAARRCEVVEILRPDARRHLKHTYLGLEEK